MSGIIASEPVPVLFTEGTPRERGKQHGELAAEKVAQSVERYLKRFEYFSNLRPTEARERAMSFMPVIEEYDADVADEIRGVAEGAAQREDDVVAVNCRSEVMFGSRPECTSFGLQPEVTATGHVYVGQNWDWAPDIKETLILLVICQPSRPTAVLLDEAGMVGRMGMNDAGIALSTNTLITEQRGAGVPYNVLLRGILNQRRMSDAIGAVVKPRRALAANYLIADGRGQVIDLEASPVHVDYLVPKDGIVTHGNHFAGARLVGRDLSLERFPDSLYRECRLREALIAETDGITEEGMVAALKDNFGSPNAICRHQDPDQHEMDRLETVASIVMDATAGRFLLARGAPDNGSYHGFDVETLAQGKALASV